MSLAEHLARTENVGPPSWLNDLRFHLGPGTTGKFVFSHVHLNNSPLNHLREGFLQDLMTGRSIAEVLACLTPGNSVSGVHLPDSATATELRAYFQHLAAQLHLSGHDH